MLVEAQLGREPFYQREQAEYEAEESCKKSKFLATWGIGRTQPAVCFSFFFFFSASKLMGFGRGAQKWEDAGKLSSELKGVLMPSTTVPPTEKNKTSQ